MQKLNKQITKINELGYLVSLHQVTHGKYRFSACALYEREPGGAKFSKATGFGQSAEQALADVIKQLEEQEFADLVGSDGEEDFSDLIG